MTLEVHDVTAGYGPITVLRDVSMQVASGEILGVLGRNGMGKSTLIRCLVRIDPPRCRPHRLRARETSPRSPRTSGRALGMTTVVQGRGMFREAHRAREPGDGADRVRARAAQPARRGARLLSRA